MYIHTGDECDSYYLFDIINDPREINNLAETEPKLIQELLHCYNKYCQEPCDTQDQGYHSKQALPTHVNVCTYMYEHGGFWQSWKSV